MPSGQAVASGAGSHLPSAQASHSAQVEHIPPAAPHADSALPAWQVVPSQHPVQQAPSRHRPPEHIAPSPAGAHTASSQLSQAPQVAQAPPAPPQAVAAVPARQASPSQQPSQQMPPKHWPPGQSLPSARGTQTFSAVHVSQGRQSGSSTHAVIMHAPPSHRLPSSQVPHEPPHPSSPHVAPSQLGVQQEPLTHTPSGQLVPSAAGSQAPALQLSHSAQVTQAEPPAPHVEGVSPSLHDPSSKHPEQQTPLWQTPPVQSVPSAAATQAPAVHCSHAAQSVSSSQVPASAAASIPPSGDGVCSNSKRPQPSIAKSRRSDARQRDTCRHSSSTTAGGRMASRFRGPCRRCEPTGRAARPR